MVLWVYLIASAAAIVYSGAQLSRYGDIIAEKTGLGRTWMGVLVMASVTSLPELMTGISAVTVARAPDIAVGGVMGSCVFNILILGCLDLVEREKPISAKAQQGHVLSGGFGVLMLSIVCFCLFWGGRMAPLGWIGAYSILIAALYVIAIRLIYFYEKRQIARFIGEQAEEFKYETYTLRAAVQNYGLHALVVTGVSLVLPGIGTGIAAATGLGQSFVGNIFIAAVTSLPEVVISVAAVRIGAIDLAIGNLLGSNIFNIGILAVEDLLFFNGPLLSSVSPVHIISGLTAVAMTGIVIIGLTYRSEKKFLFLAWDSLSIILLYPTYLMFLYAFR